MSIFESYSEGNLTRLNNLKYGEVSQTNSPLITKRIPTTIDGEGHKSNEVNRRADDLVRISKLLTRSSGLTYLRNETTLNAAQIEFKTKTKKDGTTNILGTALNAIGANLLNTVKIIGSTLAQVPFNGTGTHFVKAFGGKGKNTYLSGIDTPPHQLVRGGAPVFGDNTGIGDRDFPHTLGEQPNPTETFGGGLLNPNRTLVNTENSTEFRPRGGFTLLKPIDSKVKKESRIKLGNPSAVRRTIYEDYSIGDFLETQDQINKLGPYSGLVKGAEETRDLIKFRFNIISPEEDNNTYIHFRAFLDSFDDSFTGNWNSFNYVGRGEQFHTYNTFNRGINLSFKIAAQTRWEMRPLYQKIVTLASTTAPTYSGQGYMRGTIVRLTVGDYLYEMPGFINSVNYSWQNDYPWEIALNNPEGSEAGAASQADTDQQELPMVLNCSVSFTPIHTFIPQTGLYHYITTDVATKGNENRKLFFTKGTSSGPGLPVRQPEAALNLET